MLHALLILVAVGSLVFGVQDLLRTSSEIAQPAVTSAECPVPGAGRRLVRLNADAGPAAVMSYRMRGEGPGPGQPVVLLALNPPTGKHIVVRIALADANGQPVPGASWRAGPTAGVIVPLPASLAPMEGRDRFPPGSTISWLEREYEPSGSFPIAVLAGGAIMLALLAFQKFGGQAPRAPARPAGAVPPDERTPLLTVEATLVKRVVLVAIAIGAVAAVVVVRRDRAGEPKIHENPMVALAGFAAAIAAGWACFYRTSDGAVVCLGGLKRSDNAEDPASFVRWEEFRTVTRAGGGGITLVLETESGESIRLEPGRGAEAERAASAIASFVRPGILARLRDQLMVGKEVEFGPLRLAADGVGWELPSGWRMSEFDDVEKINVSGGTMRVKLVSSQFDDVTFRYQEAPNGFLLPLLLATGKSSARSSCRMSFRAEAPPDPFLGAAIGMDGEDAWVVRLEPPVAEALVRHAQFHLTEAEAASVRGDADGLLAQVTRALALFEGARRSDLPEVRVALLALGHALADTRQSSPARWAFERAFKLMEKDGADPIEMARARHGLAVARWQCKDTEGAVADAKRAAELLERQEGAPLVHVAFALNTLAGLERVEGHLLESQQAVDRLIARLERASADELAQIGPQRLLAMMQNVTLLMEQLEDTQLQVALHARGAEVCRRLAGADGLLVGQALFSLGTSQLTNKDPAAACGSLEKALSIFETNLGEQHPWMAACLDRLGEAYWYAGMRDQAGKAFELSAAILAAKGASA